MVRGFFGNAVALSAGRLAIGEMFEGTATTGINNRPVGIAVDSGAVHVMR